MANGDDDVVIKLAADVDAALVAFANLVSGFDNIDQVLEQVRGSAEESGYSIETFLTTFQENLTRSSIAGTDLAVTIDALLDKARELIPEEERLAKGVEEQIGPVERLAQITGEYREQQAKDAIRVSELTQQERQQVVAFTEELTQQGLSFSKVAEAAHMTTGALELILAEQKKLQDQSNPAKTDTFFESLLHGFKQSEAHAVTWGVVMADAYKKLSGGIVDAVTSFPHMIAGMAEAGDQAKTMAAQLGIPIDQMAQLKYISEQSGVPLTMMTKGLQTLGTQLQDSGSKASAAVRSIGLIPEELNKLKGPEKIEAINEAIKKMGPHFDGAGKYVEIFGAKGSKMAALVGEDIGKLNDRFKELGGGDNKQALGDLGDTFNDLSNDIKVSMDSFKESIAVSLLPGINAVLEKVPLLGGAVLSVGSVFLDTAKSMVPMITQMALMAAADKGLVGVTAMLGKMSGAVLDLTMKMLMNPWTAVAVLVVALGVAVYKLIGGWEGLVKIFDATVAAVQPLLTFLKDLWDIFRFLTEAIVGDLMKAFSDFFAATAKGESWLNKLIDGAKEFLRWVGEFPILGYIVKGITLYWESLFKAIGMVWDKAKQFFAWLGNAAHEEAEIGRQKEAAAREQQSAAEKSIAAQKEMIAYGEQYAAQQKAASAASDQMAERTRKITEAYNNLKPALKESIKAALQDNDAKTIAAAKAAEMGVSVDVATAVIDRYKKSLTEAAKAAKDNPFAKLMESAKDLALQLDAAFASGQPLNDIVDQFGKKAAEIYDKAALSKHLKDIKQGTIDVALAFTQSKIKEHLDEINKKAEETSRTFGTKMAEGTAAAVTTIRGMQDSITESNLQGSELRIHQIEKEYRATVAGVDQQQVGYQKAHDDAVRSAEESAALSTKKIEADLRAGQTITANQAAEIKDRLDKDKAAADAALAVAQALGKAQIKVGRDVADNKLALAKKMTAYAKEQEEQASRDSLNLVTLDLQQRGVITMEAREREYTKAKAALDKMLAARKSGEADFYQWEIDAAQAQVTLMESEWQKEAEARGLVTKQASQLVLDTERNKLAAMLLHEKDFTKEQIEEQKKRVKEAEIAAGSMLAVWGKAFGQIAQIGHTVGDSISQIGDAMDNPAIKKFGEGISFASDMLEGMGGIMSAMAKGDTIGAIIAGIAMATKAFTKLWDAFSESKGEKAMKDINKTFKSSTGEMLDVSEEFGNKMAESSKKWFGGNQLQGELYNLKDIIDEAGGLSEKNFGDMTKHLTEVFAQVGKGSFTVEHATKVLDENFTTFADHVLKSGQIASKGFQEIIALNAQFGTQSKEIADFVSGQMARLGKGFQSLLAPLAKPADEISKKIHDQWKDLDKLAEEREKLLKNMGDDPSRVSESDRKKLAEVTAEWEKQTQAVVKTRDEMSQMAEKAMPTVQRASRLMMASFNAAQASGMGMLDAVDQLGPGLDELLKTTEGLGITTKEAGLEWIVDFRDRVNVNRELVDSAGSLNEIMLTMSNIGALDADSFADLQAQGNSTYDELIAKGFKQGEALKMMSGYLEQARVAHEEMGLPIDENTQSLINEATAQGILKDSAMSTNDIMIEGLSAIIKALGGDMPAAFDKMSKSAQAASGTVSKAIDKGPQKSVEDTAEALEKTKWKEYAIQAEAAADKSKPPIDAVAGAAESVAAGLGKADWDGWAESAVAAAMKVQEAVDGVSLGHSPGGIKEIPIKLNEAIRAFKQWEQQGVVSAEAVEGAINGIGTSSEMVASTLQATGASSQLQQVGDIHITINTEAIDNPQRSREVAEELMDQFTQILARRTQFGVST